MGLLSSVLFYRAGRKRGERQAREEYARLEKCNNCGYPRYAHEGFRESCPE